MIRRRRGRYGRRADRGGDASLEGRLAAGRGGAVARPARARRGVAGLRVGVVLLPGAALPVHAQLGVARLAGAVV